MQLKSPKSIRGALAAATCSLLTQTGTAAENPISGWEVDASILFYNEQGRVSVTEPVLFAHKQIDDDNTLTLHGVYDSVTGASPNGATPTNTSQTFTSPSGQSSYSAAAGQMPLRDIHDERFSGGFDWEHAISRTTRNNLGGTVSSETDYFSIAGSDTLSFDSEDKLTTYSVGAGLSLDWVSPEGSTPDAFALLSNSSSSTSAEVEDEGKRKSTFDFIAGITQILSRRTLLQLNASLSYSNGYLNDPYKIISVINPGTGATVDYRYEKRPGNRRATVLYGKWVHHLDEDVVRISYRWFDDDWGVTAQTADLNYRWELGGGHYLRPHLRYYLQDGADFFRHSLNSGAPLPDYASADLRLGDFNATTIGVKYGLPVANDGELNLRVESMVQEGDGSPSSAVGIQRQYDLYPTLNATIIQVGLSVPL